MTAGLIDRFRAATPSQRCDLHAEIVRDYGRGFADLLRDLVESVERMRARPRSVPARVVVPFDRGRAA